MKEWPRRTQLVGASRGKKTKIEHNSNLNIIGPITRHSNLPDKYTKFLHPLALCLTILPVFQYARVPHPAVQGAIILKGGNYGSKDLDQT